MSDHVLITGAGGFIGSQLVDRFLKAGLVVSGIDNFARGSKHHLSQALNNDRFHLFEADLKDSSILPEVLDRVMQNGKIATVWHLAANSNIGAGAENPELDLENTFLSTFHLLSAMRRFGLRSIAFASSSAVYGKQDALISESTGPLLPISNYGAMKLASEAIISAAVESFLERAWIFRFPNVVGPRATHGVIYDLMRKLARTTSELEVLGDGEQRKQFLHSSELLDAMEVVQQKARDAINVFNIGTADEGAKVSYIAEAVVKRVAPGTSIRYTGSAPAWVGDVPKFRFSIDKIAGLGWQPSMTSQQAVERAIDEIHLEMSETCS
jgi:UDP-glucose 4-epimerase